MMQYELHINPVTYHQITAEGEKKKSAVCAVLTKQLYSQSTEGQSPVLISGRPTQEWCQNQFVWLRASPPACNATAERVIRSVIPLQHPAL